MALAYCSSNFPHLPRGSLLCKNELPYKCSSQQVGRGGANFPVSARRRLRLVNSIAPEASSQSPPQTCSAGPEMQTQTWEFRGYKYFYIVADGSSESKSPAVVLVHGFGANCRHWRSNMIPLAKRGWRVYAIDLLGFGLGDKPTPGTIDYQGDIVTYNFEFWSDQLRRFCHEVVRAKAEYECPVFIVANSIGSMVAMQASIDDTSIRSGIVFISPSLRQLNVRKRTWLQSIAAPLAVRAFAYRPLGEYFLKALSRRDQLRRVLLQAYAVQDRVDDELVQILREPALTPGALDVFLAFIMYDSGPVPEDLLPQLSCPSLILWGDLDTFEPYEAGRALRHYATVEQFVTLRGVGHCGHDESPNQVNDIIANFVESKLDRKEQVP